VGWPDAGLDGPVDRLGYSGWRSQCSNCGRKPRLITSSVPLFSTTV
jgi:hypothetical protein